MLQILGTGTPQLAGAHFLPQILSPLVVAAERGEPLEPAVSSIVRVLGFDSFMYGVNLSSARPGSEQKSYVFTTLPRAWVMRYDQCGYIEVDPRIQHCFDSALPLVWDQASERGKSAAIDRFLEDAAAHGVASGVAFAVYSASSGHVAVAFNSARPEVDDLRRYEVARNMGDMFLLGVCFHEIFMKTVIARGLPPLSLGLPLSRQETRCLSYAAHGFTSRDIAAELHVSERTIEIYFSQLRSKLGVANRQEAIAKAIDERLIRRGELPGAARDRPRAQERRKVNGVA